MDSNNLAKINRFSYVGAEQDFYDLMEALDKRLNSIDEKLDGLIGEMEGVKSLFSGEGEDMEIEYVIDNEGDDDD